MYIVKDTNKFKIKMNEYSGYGPQARFPSHMTQY